jgi:hypothetical protein
MFAPDVFPELPQNVEIDFYIHRLSQWNKLLMHVAFSVSKQMNFDLALLHTCRAFFGHSEVGVFH